MSAVKNIFNFYINSSIHVAFAVVALTTVSMIQFNVVSNFELLGFIFFATITGYNFVKYAGIAKLHHLSLAKNLRLIQIFSLIAFVFLIYFTFHQSKNVILISGILGLFTALYALPIFGNETNLRGVSGIKIFVIALVWAGVTVLLPVADHIHLYSLDVILVFIQRFFFVIVITLPFEIRDLRFDMARLGTIPQIFGIKKTRIIGFLLVGIFVLLEFFKQSSALNNVISVLLVGGVCLYSLRFATIRQTKYYSSFWVEAIPILWYGVLMILMALN